MTPSEVATPDEMADYALMGRALDLARHGIGTTHPNPMVGCVIVDQGGNVVGEGYHPEAGQPHAEVFALRQAGERARGATAYVTLEPCDHHGRTPPCSQALIDAGLGRVVVAMVDPNPLVAGKGIERLRDAGIDVSVGVLESEAQDLNRAFSHWIVQRRPFVTLKAAMSLDGQEAAASGESKWITGEPARQRSHGIRGFVDAVVVGIGTVLADDPELTDRRPGRVRQPVRVVLDRNLRIPGDSRLLASLDQAPVWVVYDPDDAPPERAEALERLGARPFPWPATPEEGLTLKRLMAALGEEGLIHLMVEGGPTLHSAFFAEGLVDEVALFIAPILLGQGGDGLMNRHPVWQMSDRIELDTTTVERLGRDLLVTARVVHAKQQGD